MVDTGITSTGHSFIATCKYRLPCGRCEKTMLMCPDNEGITINWTKTTPIDPDPKEWTVTTTSDINSDEWKKLMC